MPSPGHTYMSMSIRLQLACAHPLQSFILTSVSTGPPLLADRSMSLSFAKSHRLIRSSRHVPSSVPRSQRKQRWVARSQPDDERPSPPARVSHPLANIVSGSILSWSQCVDQGWQQYQEQLKRYYVPASFVLGSLTFGLKTSLDNYSFAADVRFEAPQQCFTPSTPSPATTPAFITTKPFQAFQALASWTQPGCHARNGCFTQPLSLHVDVSHAGHLRSMT
ncbi:hypothetical protein V8C86DRAFT_667659 [Haematococcus lacustris]